MISVKPLKSASTTADYFHGENYYTREESSAFAVSEWWGEGAQRLGLTDYHDAQFAALLAGELPTGALLGRVARGERQHRAGNDITFSAPKSVSLCALIRGDDRLVEAHVAAVKATLAVIEADMAVARVTHHGHTTMEHTHNLTVALHHHDTSRAHDPQLHTHAVVLNMTQRTDGHWRALGSQTAAHTQTVGGQGFVEQLYQRQRLMGLIYRSELAIRVRQLGYDIVRTHEDGRFEINGISSQAIAVFSKRRADIEANLAAKGLSSARAASVSALDTRTAKTVHDKTTLQAQWQHTVRANHLIDLNPYTPLPTPARMRAFSQEQGLRNIPRGEEITTHRACCASAEDMGRRAVSDAIAHLTQREAIIAEDKLMQSAMVFGLGAVTFRDIQAGLTEAVKRGVLLARVVPEWRTRAWTTPAAVALEQKTIALMQAARGTQPAMLTSSSLPAFGQLNAGQLAAATLVLTSTDGVIGIQGYAGTGKTTLLSAVRECAEHAGWTLLGLAPSANAADQLQSSSGIQSHTLQRFLVQRYSGLAHPDGDLSKHLVIVDESSLASTQQVHDVCQHVLHQKGRVVLVGDVLQLGAIDAGKPFYQLQKNGMATAVMQTIMRQRDPTLKQAVTDALLGHVKQAFEALAPTVYAFEHREQRLHAVANMYLALSETERAHTMVITAAHRDRIALNDAIRAGLKQKNSLQGPEITAPILVQQKLTDVQSQRAATYQVGDVIRFNRRYKTLGIEKGQYVSVKAIEQDTNHVLLESGKRQILWAPDHIAATRRGAIEVYRTETRTLMVGDVVRWTRNDSGQHKMNAQLATVTHISHGIAGKIHVTVQLANHALHRFALDEVSNQHWDHGYVGTVYASQGRTTERVIIHGDSQYTELEHMRAFYVAISRARMSVHLFVDNKARYLTQLLEHAGEKTSALEHLPPTPVASTSVMAAQTVVTYKPPLSNEFNKPAEKWIDREAVQSALVDRLEQVLQSEFGAPNATLSSHTQWRYGNKGSLSIQVDGSYRGFWHDFENDTKGHVLQLLQHRWGCDFKTALTRAAQLTGVKPTAPTAAFAMTSKPHPEKSITTVRLPEADDHKKIALAQRLAAESKSIHRTVAERYLREQRHIHLTSSLPTVRYHPSIWEPHTQQRYPALLIVAEKNNAIHAVQAILLDRQTAQKAAVPVNKITYGRMKFGAVALIQQGTQAIYVAEGPETALSIAHAQPHATVIATLSASNMKNLVFTDKTVPIIFCADNDGKKGEALKKVWDKATALEQQGFTTRIALPEKTGEDFNDVLRQEGVRAVKQSLQQAKLPAVFQALHLTPSLDMPKQAAKTTSLKINLTPERSVKKLEMEI